MMLVGVNIQMNIFSSENLETIHKILENILDGKKQHFIKKVSVPQNLIFIVCVSSFATLEEGSELKVLIP